MFKEPPHPIFRPFSVERKETKSQRPGVVIATCKTKANRDEILSAKKKLQFSRQYSDVSLQQRIESENVHSCQSIRLCKPRLICQGK